MLHSVTRATVVIFLYILPGAIVLKCFRSECLARPLIRVYTLVPFFFGVAVASAYDRLLLKGGHHRRRSVCLN